MDKSTENAAREYFNLLHDDGAKMSIENTNSKPMELPEWYNETLFKRGQKYFHENIFAMMAGKMAGLIAVLAVSTILDVLVYTKQSSTSKTAYKRYLATVFHTLAWYDHELKPGSKSWKSLEAVRKGHLMASKFAQQNKVGFISQKDLAITQFGFFGFICLKPEFLGIQVTLENHKAFLHFWRVIGHMIGIEDRFNLCAETWQETQSRLKIICSDVFRPNMEKSPPMFKEMASALINGLWCYNPGLTVEGTLYYSRMLCGCSGYVYMESSLNMLDKEQSNTGNQQILDKLDWYTRFMLFLEVTTHYYMLNFAIIRWYLNLQIYISTFIITYFPFLAFFSFGIEHSYVRILKGDKDKDL